MNRLHMASLRLEKLERRDLPSSYYVSLQGNDSNPGTSPTEAWKTIDRVNAGTYQPGDSILFQGGQTFHGDLFLTPAQGQGTAAAPITISSYGTGQAILRPIDNNHDGIFLYNVGGFNITNLTLRATASQMYGIYIYNDQPSGPVLPEVTVDHVQVSGYYTGIWIYGKANVPGYGAVSVTYCQLHDNAYAGLWLLGTNSYVFQNVYIGHVSAYHNPGISGQNSGYGIIVGFCNGATVERCELYDNGQLGGDNNTGAGGGLMAYDSTNVVFQYNEAHHNHSAPAVTTDGDGIDFDWGVTNSIMQYNYTHDNDGAGLLLCGCVAGTLNDGNVLRYNISENDARKNALGAIEVAATVSHTEIFNNTVFMTNVGVAGSAAFAAPYGTLTAVHIRNNIFQTSGGEPLVVAISGQTDFLFQGNDYWSASAPFIIDYGGVTYASLKSWRATGQETLNSHNVGLQRLPGLTAPGHGGTIGNADQLSSLTAYQLKSTSPLIDQGLNLAALFGIDIGPVDFYGHPLPEGDSTFSLGADEVS
jgi:hypothetical protein